MADDEALEQAIQLSLIEASIRASSLETVRVAYIQSYEIALRRSLTQSLESSTKGGGGGGLNINQHSSAPPQSSSSSSTVPPLQQGIINPPPRGCIDRNIDCIIGISICILCFIGPNVVIIIILILYPPSNDNDNDNGGSYGYRI